MSRVFSESVRFDGFSAPGVRNMSRFSQRVKSRKPEPSIDRYILPRAFLPDFQPGGQWTHCVHNILCKHPAAAAALGFLSSALVEISFSAH